MSKTHPPPARPGNRLLALLPQAEYQRLAPRLQAISLAQKQVLYKARSSIDYLYFPTSVVISVLTIMENGAAIEVASVGNEGMVGRATLVGGQTSPNEVAVQIPGDAIRMRADVLREEAGRDGPLRRVLALYDTAYSVQVSYSVACNGLHKVEKRCCRWLLTAADRVGSDVLPLTHELLATMLGVRRSSLTEVLSPLQQRGLIRGGRGKIKLLDRPGVEATSCECYRAVKDEFARLFG